jgi:two-component system, chemotaxis family, protein-glutamate methylesterase/glutaminase
MRSASAPGPTGGDHTTTEAGGNPPAVVAVVASAGGVEALSEFVSFLPVDFPAAVLVLLHIPATGPSVLPRILGRAGKLAARHPQDGDRLAGGVITVAPPDRHLVVADGQVRLLTAARENGHRPSADVLLRSVAENCGARGAGIVLSGLMDDGAAGLRALRVAGGLTLVQDPKEAAFPGMPQAAIEEAGPQLVGPVAVLAEYLCEWVAQLPGNQAGADSPQPLPVPAEPTALTCPECGGALFEHDVFGAERLRCRVGHTFSLTGMTIGKQETLEKALWAAVVALDEQADLNRRILARLSARGRTSQVERYRENIDTTEQRAAVLLGLIHELVERGSIGDEEEASNGRRT